MSRSGKLALLCCALGVLAVGCASTHHSMSFQSTPMSPDGWVAKVDEFVIVADASQSMSEPPGRRANTTIERDLLASMNRTLPELGYSGALRVFGRGGCLPKGRTNLIEGMGAYTTDTLGDAVARLKCSGGRSPLDAALQATATDLHSTGGRKAVVVVSDGMNMGRSEVDAATALKQRFGDDLCIYTIQIGNNRTGGKLLKRVAAASGCGFPTSAASLTGGTEMAKFVESVFVERDSDGDGVPDRLDKCPGTPKGVVVDADGCPVDTDGDGVPDYLDKCPDTPRGVSVDAEGCPVDSDGDGVPDHLDKCPGTPHGVTVDADGCPVDSDGDGVPDYLDKCPGTPRGVPVDGDGCPPAGISVHGGEWSVQGKVLFDVNKATIKPEAREVLGRVADFLQSNPQFRVEIEGHTDSTGTMAWNMKLSQMRADSVRAFLVEHGVAADRLTTRGFGPHEPVASNGTAEGRQLNRRVDFKPSE